MRRLEQLQRGVHVARLFHVDPQKRPGGGGASRERQQVLKARFGIQVEPKVRELDGNLRGQPALPDFLEHPQVVVAHLRRLVPARDLLAQLREHAADALPGKVGGCGERGTEILPGHEAPHRPAKEGALGELPGQPGAAGGSEQQAAGEGHGSQEIRGRARGEGRGVATGIGE